MWYQAHDPKLAEERRVTRASMATWRTATDDCCYAESLWHSGTDLTGIYQQPAGPNNICFKGFSYVEWPTFLHQPDAPTEQRWLMLNGDWVSDRKGGIYIAHSPDGLHWKYPNGEPLIFGESDTWNCIVWNPERKVFMIYMRGWHCAAVNWPTLGKGNPRRRVAYSESKELKTWSEPQVILTPDELETNDFYAFQVFRYGNDYRGQLWIYDDDVEETIEIELAWSHDGIHWSRLPDRPKFLQRGPGAGRLPDQPRRNRVVVGDDLLFIILSFHLHGAAWSTISSTVIAPN